MHINNFNLSIDLIYFRLQRKYEIDIDTDPDSDLDVGASDPGKFFSLHCYPYEIVNLIYNVYLRIRPLKGYIL